MMAMANTNQSYICTCCPTNPKRFKRACDLRNHQKITLFCCKCAKVLDEDASGEASGVLSRETNPRMDDYSSPRSEHSVDSRASQRSVHSTGSQVSDGSIETGHSVFHAMDDLIEGHLKEAFPKARLIARKTTRPAGECYKTAIKELLHKIHNRYALLINIIDVDTGDRDERLVVLYDDMKLAFNGFMSQILVEQVSEEAYAELTLQVSEFGSRLDQCMGLEPEETYTRYAASQEQDRTGPSQLTHDKMKYKGTKKHIKTLVFRNRSSKSGRSGSLVSKGTRWWKSRTAGAEGPIQSIPGTSQKVPKPAVPKLGGLHICDCCPKKPKKFDNPDDLRAHEMEKQYACAYCNNHFKNKNEAERHQNSLHLRRHSWSCAALVNFGAAFNTLDAQNCQINAGASHDMCGYCGEEFTNFPLDWDRRFDHLTIVHKFGECNNAKKFFRLDHFRQHLKHSHAGTSGKWTTILENACIKEEQPPEPLPRSGNAINGSSGKVLTSNAIWKSLVESKRRHDSC